MLEKFLFRKIEIWIVLLLAIVGTVVAVFFGASVRSYHMGGANLAALGPIGSLSETIAAIPSHTLEIIRNRNDVEAPEQRFEGVAGFKFNYLPGERPDLGYVLVHRYDGDLEMSVSELVDLNAQETVHQWRFDVDPIWEQTDLELNVVDLKVDYATKRFRNVHGYLLPNGSIVLREGIQLVVDLCSNIDVLNDDAFYHHSLETDHEGNYWFAKHIEPKTVQIGSDTFLDDGIIKVAPDGTVLFEKSVVAMLDENGLGHLIYGTGRVNNDPIHLNDIQPALSDGSFWKKGDIFLSLRHQSMILLYRPSTNEILWQQQGPWLHQHDVDILDHDRIAVFDNNARLRGHKDWVVEEFNNEYVFDFRTGKLSSPFETAFRLLDIRTITEGRGEILSPDEIFVEESNYGRLVQFNKKAEIAWQYINRASNDRVYRVNWSRMISRALGDQARKSIKTERCDAR